MFDPNQQSAQSGAQPGGESAEFGGKAIPPEVMAQIDPNDPFQQTLLERAGELAPQEISAMKAGITPQAVDALKKIIPEIGFLLDLCGQGGGMPQPEMSPQSAPGQPAPFQAAKPTTALGKIGA